MFAYPLTSKPCSEATNIGDRLSLWADFGYWGKIRIHVGELENLPEGCDFTKKYSYSIICYPKNSATALFFKFFQLICFGKI